MKQKNIKKKIICIAGATASGKSKKAFEKNLEINGSDFNGIISVDSRQIYKNIPIFSGISENEKKSHLVGFINEWESFSAGDFVKWANEKVEEIILKEKTPILVGGTSFYFKSLLYDNFLPKVPIDKKLRKRMFGKTAEELIKVLKQKDKKRANKIDRKNIPRIIRSIEIVNFLGKFPESEEKIRGDLDIEFFWINLNIKKQKKNIEINFKKRMKSGLLEEADNLKSILYQHYTKYWYKKVFYILFKKKLDKRIQNTFFNLGLVYKDIFKFWKNEIDYQEFTQLGILKEQQYAKRQNTYLKKFFDQLPKQKNIKKNKVC